MPAWIERGKGRVVKLVTCYGYLLDEVYKVKDEEVGRVYFDVYSLDGAKLGAEPVNRIGRQSKGHLNMK